MRSWTVRIAPRIRLRSGLALSATEPSGSTVRSMSVRSPGCGSRSVASFEIRIAAMSAIECRSHWSFWTPSWSSETSAPAGPVYWVMFWR